MFEQLHGRLASAAYNATATQPHVQGLVQRAGDELAALGVNTSAFDTGSASTVAGAIGIAKAAINAQSFTSLAAKQQALGKLDQLAATLAGILPGS